jgi:hypothetical protein
VLLAIAVWQGYRYFYRVPQDLTTAKAIATINAGDLIQAFDSDSAKANSIYLGKILIVQGKVTSVERENGVTIILKNEGATSSVRCSMNESNIEVAGNLQKGSLISIKGNCTGYTMDDLLGNDVILNRCVLINNENK